MIEGTSAASRRSLLRRAAVLALGALGIGATAGSVAAGPAAAAPIPGRSIHLWGRGFFLDGHGHRQGLPAADGDRGSVRGELLDGPDGESIGTFASACFFGSGDEPGDLELHTFHLADGMLVGLGATVEGEGVCAVLGGTGAYAGATGSYVARQDLRESGGDGSAEFVITLGA